MVFLPLYTNQAQKRRKRGEETAAFVSAEGDFQREAEISIFGATEFFFETMFTLSNPEEECVTLIDPANFGSPALCIVVDGYSMLVKTAAGTKYRAESKGVGVPAVREITQKELVDKLGALALKKKTGDRSVGPA